MERLFSPDNPLIRFLGRVCDLMILSVLFTLSCMLIVPSGAAMTALYSWLFPLQARFENHFSGHCRNAAALSLTQLPVTCFMTLVNLLPLLSVLLFPNRAGELITFWILFGFGGCAFVNSFYLRRVFDRVEDVSAKNDL